MVVIEAVGGDFFIVCNFFVERIDFAAAGDESEYFREGTFVGDLNDGNAAGFEYAIEFA